MTSTKSRESNFNQPIIISVENCTERTEKEVPLINPSYQDEFPFIRYKSEIGGLSYKDMIYMFSFNTFVMGLVNITAFNTDKKKATEQVKKTIDHTFIHLNGNKELRSATPKYDKKQIHKNMSFVPFHMNGTYKFGQGFNIELRELLPFTKVMVSVYPSTSKLPKNED